MLSQCRLGGPGLEPGHFEYGFALKAGVEHAPGEGSVRDVFSFGQGRVLPVGVEGDVFGRGGTGCQGLEDLSGGFEKGTRGNGLVFEVDGGRDRPGPIQFCVDDINLIHQKYAPHRFRWGFVFQGFCGTERAADRELLRQVAGSAVFDQGEDDQGEDFGG